MANSYLLRGLLNDDHDMHALYRSSATFHQALDMLVAAAPYLVKAVAETARAEDAAAEQRRRALERGPWMVPTLDADEPST